MEEILKAIDDLFLVRATKADDTDALRRLARLRSEIDSASFTQPVVYTERKVLEMIERDRTWLYRERKAGRWNHYLLDASGARYYTREQILSNLGGNHGFTSSKR